MQASGWRVALVGASSLKGKELKEVLDQRNFPIRSLALLDEEELQGTLTEFGGEPVLLQSISQESFERVDFAFFAGLPEFTHRHWKVAQSEGARIIDLTGAIEEDAPEAVVAGPFATGHLPPTQARLFAAAHPAALIVALVLRRLAARLPLTRAVVNVFEPASERGSRGIEELHQQTVSLLSFQQVPQQVFGNQLAFNLLAAVGEDVRPSLLEVEQRVVRHTGRLLGAAAPLPAVRVAQSPVFHSHSFSFYVELEQSREAQEVENALAGPDFDLRRGSEERPSAVGAASSSEVLIGDIRPDSTYRHACWLWAAADNLRVSAVNAVQIAEQLAKR